MTSGIVTRDRETFWPIADQPVPCNDPRNKCGINFGSSPLKALLNEETNVELRYVELKTWRSDIPIVSHLNDCYHYTVETLQFWSFHVVPSINCWKKKKTTIITTSDWQKGNQTSHPKVVSPQITSPKICAWVIVKRHYPGKAKTAAYIQVKKQLKLIWGEMIFTLFLVFKTKLLKQHIRCFAGPGANKLQSVTKLPRQCRQLGHTLLYLS